MRYKDRSLVEGKPKSIEPPLDIHGATKSCCRAGCRGKEPPWLHIRPEHACFVTFGRHCIEAMPTANVQPNATTYIAAISACAKGGQWQEALAMLKAKVQPNVTTACERSGQGLAVLTLFEVMLKAKVQPDVISYNAASSACEKVGQ